MVKNGSSLLDIRKNITYTHELISTAHHESSHCIYALLHYMMIHSVRVFPDKKTNRIEGFTHYDSLNIDSIQSPILLLERLHSEVGLSYAGLIGEKYQYKLHSGSDKFPSFLGDGSSKDLQEASEMIKKYQLAPPGTKRYNYKKRMVRKTTKEIIDNWEAITVVAHALFKRKRINFEDLKKLLTKKIADKDFWKEQFRIIGDLYTNSTIEEDKFIQILQLK
jgi:hypothetical protein